MKVSNTSNRLKELMRAKDLKQVDILNKAQALGNIYDVKFNKSDLSQYVSGKTEPNQDKLFILSKALDVDVTWLMGYDVPSNVPIYTNKIGFYALTDRELDNTEKYRMLDDISKEVVDVVINKEFERSYRSYTINNTIIEKDHTYYKKIPFYNKLTFAETDQYGFNIPIDIIKVDAWKYKKADYAIQVNGDSMKPTYNDGDVLIVERYAVPEKGQIGIFIVDGMGYVKRMGDGELISDNKNYPNVVGEYGECMGKVLGKL